MTARSGSCAVCGQSAATRCGPCGSQGIEIWFCNREHQKMVWKVHKRVCGLPHFRWPDLSAKEVKMIHEIKHIHNRQLGQSLMEAMCSSGPTQFNEMVTACSCDHTDIVREDDMLGIRNQTIADIRAVVLKIRFPNEPSRRPDLAPEVRFIHDIAEEPIGWLSTFEKELWPDLVTQRKLGSWFDALQHKLVIAFALIAVVNDPTIETKPLRLKNVFHAVEEVRSFVYTSVHPSYPSQARQLNAAVQGLSGAALNAIGGLETLQRAM